MKTKHIVPAIYLVVTALSLNCNAQKSQLNFDDAEKEIAKSSEFYFKAFASNDASMLVSLYTNDSWIMSPETPAMCGPDAASDFFTKAYKDWGVRKGKFFSTELFGDGNEFVTESGLFQLRDGSDKIISNGAFIMLWKKTNDGWKILRSSFSH